MSDERIHDSRIHTDLGYAVRDEPDWAVAEIERLRSNWSDLYLRLAQARHTLMAMHSQTSPPDARLGGKREGVDVALDYMRAYDEGGRNFG